MAGRQHGGVAKGKPAKPFFPRQIHPRTLPDPRDGPKIPVVQLAGHRVGKIFLSARHEDACAKQDDAFGLVGFEEGGEQMRYGLRISSLNSKFLKRFFFGSNSKLRSLGVGLNR